MPRMICLAFAALAASLAGVLPGVAHADDVVRLGNLKFAHYGAVSYTKESCAKYGLKIEERMFPKGPDIVPAIVAGEIDIAALASDGAISGRANGVPSRSSCCAFCGSAACNGWAATPTFPSTFG